MHFALPLLCAFALCAAAVAQAPLRFAEHGPILPSERAALWPSRAVAAPDFHDAFCAVSTDGCETCRRAQVNDEARCEPMPTGRKDGVCERKAVQCREMLPSAYRVCLGYSDGCNSTNALGQTTLIACPRPAPESESGFHVDLSCQAPRSTHYDQDFLQAADWFGTWALQAPGAASCLLWYGPSFRGDLDLGDACSKLPFAFPPDKATVSRGRLQLWTDSRAGGVIMTFEPQAPGRLADVDGAGWTLEQIDVDR